MLIIALVFFVLAGFILRAKRQPDMPNSSRLYRIDNRVVASVLVVLAVVFVVLGLSSGRLLF